MKTNWQFIGLLIAGLTFAVTLVWYAESFKADIIAAISQANHDSQLAQATSQDDINFRIGYYTCLSSGKVNLPPPSFLLRGD